jgi:hypothetical protein
MRGGGKVNTLLIAAINSVFCQSGGSFFALALFFMTVFSVIILFLLRWPARVDKISFV